MNAAKDDCPFRVPALWTIFTSTCRRLASRPVQSARQLVWRDDLLARATAAIRAGQRTQAAKLLAYHEQPLARDPAFLNLAGIIVETGGMIKAARRFYGLAISIHPDYAPAQQNLRRLYELDTFGRTAEFVALGDEEVRIPRSAPAFRPGTSSTPVAEPHAPLKAAVNQLSDCH